MANEADQNREDVVIQDHEYDGIREYDNPMPGWWLWIFWGSVIWAPIYILGVHAFDLIPTYEEDLARGQSEIQEVRDAWELANPSFEVTEENLAAFVSDPAAIEAGKVDFAAYCASCHGLVGEGLIGPNLTDAYWIHGASSTDIFAVITDGVLERGMAPWGSILSADQRARLVAFVVSLQGTEPTGGKAPEGEPASALPAPDAAD